MVLPCFFPTQHFTEMELPTKHCRICKLLIGYKFPQGSQQLWPFPELPLFSTSHYSSTPQKDEFLLFWLLSAVNAQEDRGRRVLAHYSDVHWHSALGCSNDLPEINCCRHIVPSSDSDQGQVDWVSHSRCYLKFTKSLHSTSPSHTHTPTHLYFGTTLCYDLWYPTWNITSLLCPQLYSSDQNRQEYRAVYLLTERTSSITAMGMHTRIQKTHTPINQLFQIQSHRGTSWETEGHFSRLSTCRALITILVTFIRQMQTESRGNTGHTLNTKAFLCLKG